MIGKHVEGLAEGIGYAGIDAITAKVLAFIAGD